MTSSPASGLRGALALGQITREKPSFSASRSRSWPRGDGRTSPARPSSPNTASPCGSGRFFSDDSTASTTARSAAGSVMRTPPTAFRNTS